jgi:hypothetical protein
VRISIIIVGSLGGRKSESIVVVIDVVEGHSIILIINAELGLREIEVGVVGVLEESILGGEFAVADAEDGEGYTHQSESNTNSDNDTERNTNGGAFLGGRSRLGVLGVVAALVVDDVSDGLLAANALSRNSLVVSQCASRACGVGPPSEIDATVGDGGDGRSGLRRHSLGRAAEGQGRFPGSTREAALSAVEPQQNTSRGGDEALSSETRAIVELGGGGGKRRRSADEGCISIASLRDSKTGVHLQVRISLSSLVWSQLGSGSREIAPIVGGLSDLD